MKKEYRHKGACPIIVHGFGRVNPGVQSFVCDMDPTQEEFFLRIGAIVVLKEVPILPHFPVKCGFFVQPFLSQSNYPANLKVTLR